MVNGPPCPQCGFTLRWLAPQNGWGCDRCQKMFAPQQVQQPAYTPTPQPPVPTGYPPTQTPPHGYGPPQGQPPYTPHPHATPHPPPAAGGKSKKGLIIGLSLAGLALAGGVIALVLVMRGKSSAAGGSRDDVLRATFAAMAAGDAEELANLSSVESFYSRAIECKERDKDDEVSEERREWEEEMRDPKKLLERTKKAAAKTVLRTKGTKIEVVDILTKEPKPLAGDEKEPSNKKKKRGSDDEDEDEGGRRGEDSDLDDERTEDERDTKTFVMKKGKEVMPGCKAKETFRFQTVKVKLKITEGTGEPFEHVAKIGLTNLGNGWYLTEPPQLPVGYDALAADLEPWREKMCKCADEKCAVSTGKDVEKEYGRLERLVDDDPFADDDEAEIPKEKTAKLRKVIDDMKACAGKAAGGAVVAKMTELKNAMCACKDKACADKVMNDMTEYGRTQAKEKMPSDDVMKQITPLTKELTDCMMKTMASATALSSISPATGTDGAEVTLNGSGFYGSTPMSVYFGTQRGIIVRTESDTALRVLAPKVVPGTTGPVDVVVNMSDGKELRLPAAFTYEAAAEDPLPPEDATAGGSKLKPAKNLPSSCERYRLALARAESCAKYPQSAKDGLVKAWESMSRTDATWNRASASLKKSMTDTCEMGAKAMNDALRSMGC